MQVLDFANRKRHEYVGSELERREDSKKFPSSSRGQVDFLIAGQVITFKAHLPQESHLKKHHLTKT